MPASKEQLKAFVQKYRDAFQKAGGKNPPDEQTIIQKMEQRKVETAQEAEQAAQQDAQQSTSSQKS
jgi:hypothetical protein